MQERYHNSHLRRRIGIVRYVPSAFAAESAGQRRAGRRKSSRARRCTAERVRVRGAGAGIGGIGAGYSIDRKTGLFSLSFIFFFDLKLKFGPWHRR